MLVLRIVGLRACCFILVLFVGLLEWTRMFHTAQEPESDRGGTKVKKGHHSSMCSATYWLDLLCTYEIAGVLINNGKHVLGTTYKKK